MSDIVPLPLDRWCASGPVRLSADGSLQVSLRSADPVRVSLRRTSSDDAELAATWTAPPWLATPSNRLLPPLADLAQATAIQRSALLDWAVEGADISLRLPLYLDGMSRHTFIEAACEVARAHGALASAAAALAQSRDELDEVARTIAEAEAAAAASTGSNSQPAGETATTASVATPAGTSGTSSINEPIPMAPATSSNVPDPMLPAGGLDQPMPMGAAGTGNQPTPMTTGTNAYGPNAYAATVSWQPSHLVPPEGLPAWETPDGRTAPAAQLWGGLPVQVVEHWNGWARIVCSNEWTAWVDAARLQSRPGPS